MFPRLDSQVQKILFFVIIVLLFVVYSTTVQALQNGNFIRFKRPYKAKALKCFMEGILRSLKAFKSTFREIQFLM